MKDAFCRLVICCVALFSAGSANAEPISPLQAKSLAESFLSAKGKAVAGQVAAMAAPGSSAYSADAAYYIFNAQDGGFVIISGDDATISLLGYSDNGCYDPDQQPDGLRGLLQSYEQQIGRLRLSGYKNRTATAKSPVATAVPVRRNIEPLMATRWNQGNPYNLLCPHFYNQNGSVGDLCATGCVATAVAQVMAFYRYPSATTRTIPGYMQRYSTDQGDKSVQLRNVPANSVIDWDNMLDDYHGGETEAQQLAVAQLSYWVGLGSHMDYGPSSATYLRDALNALKTYFGYDDGAHIEERSKHTLRSWDDLLYNELETSHPIAFSAVNAGGGHAFVIDGYDIDGLYHVNWGWGGMANGYFRMDVLNPDNSDGVDSAPEPNGYNMGQEAIIGLQLPDDVPAPSEGYRLTVNDWQIIDGHYFSANYVNWSGVNADWQCGLGYRGDDGSIVVLGQFSRHIDVNYYSNCVFDVSGIDKDGLRIFPISKRTVDQQWQTHVNPDISYILAEVGDDGQVSLSIHPIEDVEVTGIAFPGNHKRGDTQQVMVSFQNHGEEYFHEVFFFAGRNQASRISLGRTAVTIAENSDAMASFSFTPGENGSWTVWVTSDSEGRNVMSQATVEITQDGMSSDSHLRYVSMTVANRSNGAIYGNCVSGKVSVLNQDSEPFDGKLVLWLFKLESDGYYYGGEKLFVPIHAESGKVAQAPFLFNQLQVDATYALAVQYEQGGDITDGGLKQLGRTQKGVVCWLADNTLKGMAPASMVNTPSNALAVDLSLLGNYAVTVHPNANPNTLYILDKEATVPEGLEEANVVRGAHSDAIHLEGGWGFLSPIRFNADVVSYQCEPVKGKWQTIVLPFTPDAVPEGVQLLAFSSVSDDNMPVFTTASSMLRHVPCLYRVDDDGLLLFTGTGQAFSATSSSTMAVGTGDYRFVGTTVTRNLANVMVLNDEADAFVRPSGEVRVGAFSAWFAAPESLSSIPVPNDIESGLAEHLSDSHTLPSVYFNLNGQRVSAPQHGVYVVNGRKVVVR